MTWRYQSVNSSTLVYSDNQKWTVTATTQSNKATEVQGVTGNMVQHCVRRCSPQAMLTEGTRTAAFCCTSGDSPLPFSLCKSQARSVVTKLVTRITFQYSEMGKGSTECAHLKTASCQPRMLPETTKPTNNYV
jgi:hypothetical protein